MSGSWSKDHTLCIACLCTHPFTGMVCVASFGRLCTDLGTRHRETQRVKVSEEILNTVDSLWEPIYPSSMEGSCSPAPCWALAFQKVLSRPSAWRKQFTTICTQVWWSWSKSVYKCSLTGEGPWGLDGVVGPLGPMELRNFRGGPSIKMSLVQSLTHPDLPSGCLSLFLLFTSSESPCPNVVLCITSPGRGSAPQLSVQQASSELSGGVTGLPAMQSNLRALLLPASLPWGSEFDL